MHLQVAVMFLATVALVLATIVKKVFESARVCAGGPFFHRRYKKMNNIFYIPVGNYFGKAAEACYLVYAPLKNQFFLTRDPAHDPLPPLDAEEPAPQEVTTDSFVTLHLLLNEKCNFHCSYCYSAQGRSDAELTMEQIEPVLRWFLSKERTAPKKRTVMFMGGGEPVLSWKKLVEATLLAEAIGREEGVQVGFQLTTNGSLMTEEMLEFLKEKRFRVQVSFEVLPDVQEAQRGVYQRVADNIVRLGAKGIDHYIRATITPANQERIREMVEWCHVHFPDTKKLSCQQVVDADYFATPQIVHDFFRRYFESFKEGEQLAKKYGIELRSSSSHLLDYQQRERFCYNLAVLTPYGTLTTCPDVSSPQEKDYPSAVFGEVKDGKVVFEDEAFRRLTRGSIRYYDTCRECFARWNCGSGCPSSRRVYREEIFDAVCDHYRAMLTESLMQRLAERYQKSTGKDLFQSIGQQL